MNKITTLAAISALLFSSASFSTIISFDFSTPNHIGGTHDSINYTIGGVSLDVTAWTINNNGNGAINSATQVTGNYKGVQAGADGLGVKTKAAGSDNKLDGNGHNEALLFSFDQDVFLDFINFGSWGSIDNFNLTLGGINGNTILNSFSSSDTSLFVSGITGGSNNDHFHLSGVYGNQFLIWGDHRSDSFRVDDIKITAAVPEPSVIALLGLGLVGLTLVRRRKHS